MRKIIQIASAGDRLFSLCDDGSVWQYLWSRENCRGFGWWVQLECVPEPPQDDPIAGLI
jgi:hypothetical protein